MKKTFTALLIAAVCVLFFVSPVSAANRVPEMEIEGAITEEEFTAKKKHLRR